MQWQMRGGVGFGFGFEFDLPATAASVDLHEASLQSSRFRSG
jgi:hypothetical protein